LTIILRAGRLSRERLLERKVVTPLVVANNNSHFSSMCAEIKILFRKTLPTRKEH
jgi:hypothetical protein